jgi:hypothetical protein
MKRKPKRFSTSTFGFCAEQAERAELDSAG